MKNYYQNNSISVILYYNGNKVDYSSQHFDHRIYEMISRLLEISIINDEQFISNYNMYKDSFIIPNNNFIEYGINNKKRFLKKFNFKEYSSTITEHSSDNIILKSGRNIRTIEICSHLFELLNYDLSFLSIFNDESLIIHHNIIKDSLDNIIDEFFNIRLFCIVKIENIRIFDSIINKNFKSKENLLKYFIFIRDLCINNKLNFFEIDKLSLNKGYSIEFNNFNINRLNSIIYLIFKYRLNIDNRVPDIQRFKISITFFNNKKFYDIFDNLLTRVKNALENPIVMVQYKGEENMLEK